jgi:hypothetical protein
MNCEEQWKDNNDLHIDTLDVYLLEVRETFMERKTKASLTCLLDAVYRG